MKNDNAKFKICPLCVAVSGMWLALSAGVAWGFLMPSSFLISIALLMGGSVVGIADRCSTLIWKTITIIVSMPLAYLAVTHLNKTVVFAELIIMLGIAYLLFVKRPDGSENSDSIRKLEEQMKQCC